MKKFLSIICALALILTFASCKNGESDRSNTTVTGKVTAIDGTKITLALGEVSKEQNQDGAPTPPDGQTPDGQTSGGQAPSGDQNGTPPAKPDEQSGDSANGNAQPAGGGQTPGGQAPSGDQNGTPPAKPDEQSGGTTEGNGQAAGGAQPPEMGEDGGNEVSFTESGETLTVDVKDVEITENGQTVSADELEEGDILTIAYGDKNSIESIEIYTVSKGASQGGGFGGSTTVTQGESANTITENGDYSGGTYISESDDENALRIDGAAVTLDGITVNKNAGASSNTENGDFYGVNAALLATNGATVTITNAKVNSSAQNGNGVFSYGSGTTVNISDSTITTTADNSGGIQTTGGATTNASNLTVDTSGNSSAAVRSDRGGGTVNVDGGSYTSNGYNSPAVYSTAAITVKNAALTANNSEAIVVEGQNSVTLENCTVYGNMSDTKGSSSDENVHNVMIYQSMSGDAEVGTAAFSMSGGSLTSNNGDMFYITNTTCNLTLSGVTLKNNDSDGLLLKVCGNSAQKGWGTAGANGAQVTFAANNQTLDGNIEVDSISTLKMTLGSGSVFNGTINVVENAQNGTAVSDNADITVESGAVWNLTGNCTLSTLTVNGTINYNGYTITLADGTVLGQ